MCGNIARDQVGVESVRTLLEESLQRSSRSEVRVYASTVGKAARFVVSASEVDLPGFCLDGPTRIMILAVARNLEMEFEVVLERRGRRLL